MKRLYSLFVFVLLSAFCGVPESFGCTAAVISGKITPDGRPLLWKHRDTGFWENCVKLFSGKKYSFIAVVNSEAADPDEVWIGTNNAGFSIMNTQSYNLVEVKPGEERGAANGRVMRMALEVCADVEDFRKFLDTLSKPSLIEANFGVIDAKGGASIFEVDYYNYTEFDANNPKDAPYGYIARTNFSFTGKINEGAGYIRFMTAERTLMPAAASGMITPEWIFDELSRNFSHPMLGKDLRSGEFNRPASNGWFIDQDFIPRRNTSSTVVIKGVHPGENPDLTVMWTVLGYPPTGVALPVWMGAASKALPSMLVKDRKLGDAPLSDKSLALAAKVFSYNQGTGSDKYFYWELLFNNQKTGFMQLLAPVEDEVFRRTAPVMENCYEKGKVDVEAVRLLYGELDGYVGEMYRTLFGL